MLKYWKWDTRTRCGVFCVADCVSRSTVQEFLENFCEEIVTITLENDNNSGSEFYMTCARKKGRIEKGLCMVQYRVKENGIICTTGGQLSTYTRERIVAKVPQKAQKRSYDYERSYGKINPLAFVDYFGRKPKGKDY